MTSTKPVSYDALEKQAQDLHKEIQGFNTIADRDLRYGYKSTHVSALADHAMMMRLYGFSERALEWAAVASQNAEPESPLKKKCLGEVGLCLDQVALRHGLERAQDLAASDASSAKVMGDIARQQVVEEWNKTTKENGGIDTYNYYEQTAHRLHSSLQRFDHYVYDTRHDRFEEKKPLAQLLADNAQHMRERGFPERSLTWVGVADQNTEPGTSLKIKLSSDYTSCLDNIHVSHGGRHALNVAIQDSNSLSLTGAKELEQTSVAWVSKELSTMIENGQNDDVRWLLQDYSGNNRDNRGSKHVLSEPMKSLLHEVYAQVSDRSGGSGPKTPGVRSAAPGQHRL